MNTVIDSVPVIFVNPFTGYIEQMPVEMIGAYIMDTSMLNLEAAAKMATYRDVDAANNLLDSILEPYSVPVLEGCGFDPLAVEPPSLR